MGVLKIPGINGKGEDVSTAVNVESDHLHDKDIVKIQDRELKPNEVDKIAAT